MPPSFAKNPTWENFRRDIPVEKISRRYWDQRLLDRPGRAIARAVHQRVDGVPVQRIASVFCVSTDTVEKALRNEGGDNLDEDERFIQDYFRVRFYPKATVEVPKPVREVPLSTTSREGPCSTAGSNVDDDDSLDPENSSDVDDGIGVELKDSDGRDTANGTRDARVTGRRRRAANADAKREYWPNPRAINFKRGLAISLPSSMGTRSPSKKIDRPGRAISRIMNNYDYSAAAIGRIYSGVTHNVIGRSIKNIWCPPDDVSHDYVEAGRDYYEHFPPEDATSYIIPQEWTTGEIDETEREEETKDNDDEDEPADHEPTEDEPADDERADDEPAEDTFDTSLSAVNDPTANDQDAHDSLFGDDEDADCDMLLSDNEGAGRHRPVDEASKSLSRVKREAEMTVLQRPVKRERSVIYISDDEAPPAKRQNSIPTRPVDKAQFKTGYLLSTRSGNAEDASPSESAQVKVEGGDDELLRTFLAGVPGGGLSDYYSLFVMKGIESRRQLEAWVHLTEEERLKNIRFLFGGHLNQYRMGMLDTALTRLFDTM